MKFAESFFEQIKTAGFFSPYYTKPKSKAHERDRLKARKSKLMLATGGSLVADAVHRAYGAFTRPYVPESNTRTGVSVALLAANFAAAERQRRKLKEIDKRHGVRYE